MKITAATVEGAFAQVTFTRDEVSVTKAVRVAQRCHPDGSPYFGEQDGKATMRELSRKAREADRDIAYMQHGDAWVEHCEFKSNFFDPLLLEQLQALL